MANYFKNHDYKIVSIEYNKYTPEVKNAYKNLKDYKNLTLLFGNSFEILPKLITEDCCILIDGPKRLKAIKLAINSLKNPLVKAIFIHDLYRDSPHRKDTEKTFLNFFFTDDYDYVKKFRYLDKQNWIDQRKYKEHRSWGPYKRGEKKMKSYSSTLLVVFNSNNFCDMSQFKKHTDEYKNIKRYWSIKYLIDGWPKRLMKIIQFPINYIFYEKVYNSKKQISKRELLKKWILFTYQIVKKLFRKRVSYYKIDE